MCSLFEQAYFK